MVVSDEPIILGANRIHYLGGNLQFHNAWHGDGFPFPANPYNRCLAEAALSYLPEGVISIPDAAA